MKKTCTCSISTTKTLKSHVHFEIQARVSWKFSVKIHKYMCKTMKHRFPHHLNTSCFLCVARRACKNHMWTSTMNNKTQNNKTQTTKHRTTKQTNTKHRRTQYMCINIYIYIYSSLVRHESFCCLGSDPQSE